MNKAYRLNVRHYAVLLTTICLLSKVEPHIFAQQQLYFPESDAAWETVTPQLVGWHEEKLSVALDVAGARNSSGVLILHNGGALLAGG